MELAARQHGVISRRQLLEAGFSSSAIVRRTEMGWLRPLHLGVYTVGPVPAPRAAEMAAVLACGARSAISHASAAFLWQLTSAPSKPEPVEVTVVDRECPRRGSLRVHRTRRLGGEDVTELEGIRITTPARTILDLAGRSSAKQVERMLGRAVDLSLTTPAEMMGLLAVHPRRWGNAVVRELIALDLESRSTDSQAEEAFLELIRKSRLPLPRTVAAILSHRLDFYWSKERFAVEVDGFAVHSRRTTFESDRVRDAELLAAGVRVMRVTWRQITREPEALVALLAQSLVSS